MMHIMGKSLESFESNYCSPKGTPEMTMHAITYGWALAYYACILLSKVKLMLVSIKKYARRSKLSDQN